MQNEYGKIRDRVKGWRDSLFDTAANESLERRKQKRIRQKGHMLSTLINIAERVEAAKNANPRDCDNDDHETERQCPQCGACFRCIDELTGAVK